MSEKLEEETLDAVINFSSDTELILEEEKKVDEIDEAKDVKNLSKSEDKALLNVSEFEEIIKDLTKNLEVNILQNEVQHYATSRYNHCESVAYYTYLICKKFNLDYVSAARGAMLHDFYLYDWRNKDVERDEKHTSLHPKLALENASKFFELNDMEKDIISKHMWPMTLALPKYKETFIVTCVDKYCATKEFFFYLKNKKEYKQEKRSFEEKEKNELFKREDKIK